MFSKALRWRSQRCIAWKRYRTISQSLISVISFYPHAGCESSSRHWPELPTRVSRTGSGQQRFCLLRKGAVVNTSNDESYTALHLAAGHGITAVLEVLLDLGAELEARDSDGWTPLHWAVRFGREFNVGELLRRGANPHAGTRAGVLLANVGFVETVSERTRDLITAALEKH